MKHSGMLKAALTIVGVAIGLAVISWMPPQTSSRAASGFSPPRRSSPLPQNTTSQEPIRHLPVPNARRGFHFYNPLRDPPPYATAKELRRWQHNFMTYILLQGGGLNPNLSGPPLATVYASEAAQAQRGNTQAASQLLEGLVYCSLVEEVTVFQTPEGDRYCAGLPRSLYSYPSLNRWAPIAIRSGNPISMYVAANFAFKATYDAAHPRSLPTFLMSVTKHAAQAGVVLAWAQLSSSYEHGVYGVPVDPTRAFASLYTEYMLTKSPALAHQIWQSSQGEFNPEEIARGMKIARRDYRDIREGKKPHIPLTEGRIHP